VRTGAVLALGAFIVHQLRYLAAMGHAPGGSEHSYLRVVLPVLVVLAVSSAIGATAAALTNGPENARGAGWTFCTAALLVIFLAQETAEGLAPFAHGGWTAVPIAIVVGRLASLLFRFFRSVERRLAPTHVSVPRAPSVLGRARRADRRTVAQSPLAFGLARRPPPFALG
jgi:hypothetical protein